MIFGCGLSRTGNTSLAQALRILGYTPIKYPLSFKGLGNIYNAAVDITVIAWLDQLDFNFPDAKWILTVRDIEDWLKSCEIFFNRSLSDFDPSIKSFFIETRKVVYGRDTFDRCVWLEVYNKHYHRVITKFKPEKLLILNLDNDNSWEKLCSFIEKPIPNVTFPYLNTCYNYEAFPHQKYIG